ncbi:TIR domain-containing protein [Chloroflexota bacterium]
MEKYKNYTNTRFSVEVIKEARQSLFPNIDTKDLYARLEVTLDNATWTHDSEEEFFSDYRDSKYRANYDLIRDKRRLIVAYDTVYPRLTNSRVLVEAEDRITIEKVFGIFEKHLEACRLPEPEPEPRIEPEPKIPTIFIGHGHSPLWKELKDHLHEKHKYEVTAYDIGARAGHTVRDILQSMLHESSFAILVLTGEDEMEDGTLRARQNVVHEAGLFQGHLGFNKAIVVLEENTESFSNIDGIDQIRFSKGNIKETFGDILATLKREVG